MDSACFVNFNAAYWGAGLAAWVEPGLRAAGEGVVGPSQQGAEVASPHACPVAHPCPAVAASNRHGDAVEACVRPFVVVQQTHRAARSPAA